MRMMTVLALVLMMSSVQFGRAQDAPQNPTESQTGEESEKLSPDQEAIRAGSQAFVAAFNQHDAKALAALWSEDAEYIDDEGARYVGRDSIEQMYSSFFESNDSVKLQVAIDSIRVVGDQVAIEDGRALMQPPPTGPLGVSKYTAVHVKVGGEWKMASVRDTWIETSATRQNTSDLEWLIGDWEAEEYGNRAESSFRWVANGSFVQRTHKTTMVDGTTTSGVQLIGWNPTEGCVQSWDFGADGGHAVGRWSLTQSGWTAEIVGVTGDGLPTSSTSSLKRLDDNAYVWQSSQRSVGGVALPDTNEVVIKRQAP